MYNIFLLAIGPSLALLLFFYYIDKYDREPISLLVKLFVGGMAAVIPILILELILMRLNFFPGLLGAAYTAFIVAGFSEEFFKRFVVLKVAFRDEHFNEHLDGIIYCVFASLGMATVENVLYLLSTENAFTVGVMRGLVSVPMHMLFAVTMGYYLAFARFAQTPEKRSRYLKLSLTQPLLLHGIFDFLLMSGHTILIFLAVPFVIWSWRYNYKKLKVYYNASKTAYLRAESMATSDNISGFYETDDLEEKNL